MRIVLHTGVLQTQIRNIGDPAERYQHRIRLQHCHTVLVLDMDDDLAIFLRESMRPRCEENPQALVTENPDESVGQFLIVLLEEAGRPLEDRDFYAQPIQRGSHLHADWPGPENDH